MGKPYCKLQLRCNNSDGRRFKDSSDGKQHQNISYFSHNKC